MMDNAERNRQIKKLLEAEFGKGAVRIKGGRGSSYGWVHVYIDKTPLDNDEAESLRAKATQIIKQSGAPLGTYYSDDYSDQRAYGRLTIRFKSIRYRQTLRH